MDIRKQDVLTREWIIEVKGHIFPLSMVGKMINTIMLFVLVALAYNIGQNDAYQIVGISAYLSNGYYDPITNTYTTCEPILKGTQVVFDCIKNETTSEYRTYEKLV